MGSQLDSKNESLRANFDKILPQLTKQIRYVTGNSTFYQDKIRQKVEITSLTDFLQLPFTIKSELLLDQENNPPFGSNLCVNIDKIKRIHKTSGTTTRPLLIALTDKDIKTTVTIGKKCFASSGLTEKDVVVHCLSYSMWMGGYTDHQSLEATGAAVIPFGVGNTNNLIDTILLLKPSAIHCTPSYLAKLELVLKEEGRFTPKDLGLKLGLFGAESGLQNPNFRKNIENVWGLKAMNANYGMADVLSMFGAECEKQIGLHFMAENVLYPEIIDYQTEELLPIEKDIEGELLLTNLKREAQPLIRYRTNDIIKILSIEECDCGLKGFRFEVLGRSDDMITIKGINVFVSAIERLISENLEFLTGVFQVFINKNDPIDKILVRIEVKQYQKSRDIDFRNQMLNKFKVRLDIKPEIEFVSEGALPRTEGKSKKIYRVL